jgi:hypothetical protein
VASPPYKDQLRACSEEVQQLLTRLTERHPAMVVFAALTEHVRGGLAYCRNAGIISTADVRAVLTRLRHRSFLKPPRPAPVGSNARKGR